MDVQMVLGTDEFGESTQGEAWLMVIAGLQLVWVSPVVDGRGAASGGVNSVVGLLAELLVL